MRYLLSILIFTLTTCAEKPNKKNVRFIDEGLMELVTSFEEDFGVHIGFEVRWVDTIHSGFIGVCNVQGSYRQVLMLRSYKNSIYLNQMLYHELGHCALNLQHDDSERDIMNSSVTPDVNYYWDFYVQQMIDKYLDSKYKTFIHGAGCSH